MSEEQKPKIVSVDLANQHQPTSNNEEQKPKIVSVDLANQHQPTSNNEEQKPKIVSVDLANQPKKEERVVTIGESFAATDLVPYSKEYLHAKGKYYPENWRFYLRKLSGDAMEFFSQVNENDYLDTHLKQDYVIEKGLVIRNGHNEVSWRNVLEFDRFHLFLAIRDNTFLDQKSETDISWKATCPKGHNNSVSLDKHSLQYKGISSFIDSCWNERERLFILDGTDHRLPDDQKFDGQIRYIISTIGHFENYAKFTRWLRQTKREIKQKHIALFSTLFTNEPITDNKEELDKIFTHYINEVDKVTMKKGFFDALMNFIEFAQVTIKPELRKKCSVTGCDSEVSTEIQFPDGLRNFFNTKNKLKALFGS